MVTQRLKQYHIQHNLVLSLFKSVVILIDFVTFLSVQQCRNCVIILICCNSVLLNIQSIILYVGVLDPGVDGLKRLQLTPKYIVIPLIDMCGCDWFKWRHVV